jgi:hypothetical protein
LRVSPARWRPDVVGRWPGTERCRGRRAPRDGVPPRWGIARRLPGAMGCGPSPGSGGIPDRRDERRRRVPRR